MESATDADLYTRLFVPRHQAVTVIRQGDYERFLRRMGQPEFNDEIRAQYPMLIDEDSSRVLQTMLLPAGLSIGGPGFTPVLILLPGSSANCFGEVLREGGQSFDVDFNTSVDFPSRSLNSISK